MKTPAQFAHSIKDIRDQAASLKEKSSPSVDLEKLKEAAEELEQELLMDLQATQSRFLGKEASTRMDQQHLSGKKRAESESRLQQEKEKTLEPYLELKDQIRELIEDLQKNVG